LITYDEAQELRNLAPLLCCNNFLIDWRAGDYLAFVYLWIYPEYRSFYNMNAQARFLFAGAYGLLITPQYLEDFTGVWIFRKNALQMLESYSYKIANYSLSVFQKTSVVYSGNIHLYLFSH